MVPKGDLQGQEVHRKKTNIRLRFNVTKHPTLGGVFDLEQNIQGFTLAEIPVFCRFPAPYDME